MENQNNILVLDFTRHSKCLLFVAKSFCNDENSFSRADEESLANSTVKDLSACVLSFETKYYSAIVSLHVLYPSILPKTNRYSSIISSYQAVVLGFDDYQLSSTDFVLPDSMNDFLHQNGIEKKSLLSHASTKLTLCFSNGDSQSENHDTGLKWYRMSHQEAQAHNWCVRNGWDWIMVPLESDRKSVVNCLQYVRQTLECTHWRVLNLHDRSRRLRRQPSVDGYRAHDSDGDNTDNENEEFGPYQSANDP